jgi:formylglycine-generating enzyme required for sulfatase activity
MHGNVWEWCYDWWGVYGKGDVSDPASPSEQATFRIDRGGGWDFDWSSSQSGFHYRRPPGSRLGSSGFRVARSSVR